MGERRSEVDHRVIALLFVILIIVAIGLHEFGHFITAKKFGMKVDKFFIGFGPPIWSTKRGETEYGFAWIPAGGYVRIAGMNPFEEVAEEDRDRIFKAKKPWQRAIVLAAGSTMHFIIAFVILTALLMTAGEYKASKTVDEVTKDTPAAAAGFRTGDTVLSVDGMPVETWDDVRDKIRAKPGERAAFGIVRDGGRLTLEATLRQGVDEETGKAVGFLGVSPSVDTVRYGPVTAVAKSGAFIGTGTWQTLKALGTLVSPNTFTTMWRTLRGQQERDPNGPASLVGVTRAAQQTGFVGAMFLFVGFNIFIGVANLLPLPPLDGGHLAVLAYEKVRRREVDMRKLIPVTAVVIAFFVGLFVLSMTLDIVRPLPDLG